MKPKLVLEQSVSYKKIFYNQIIIFLCEYVFQLLYITITNLWETNEFKTFYNFIHLLMYVWERSIQL